MERNVETKWHNQRRMGPAPFASFEDLSDEMESPGDDKDPTNSIIRLPGIIEQDSNIASPTDFKNINQPMGISLIGSTSRNAFSTSQNSATHSPLLNKAKPSITPRIDISRASSSSHQDSRDSTPEREICDSIEDNNIKLGLGFKEDGALELRLSTEELDFQETSENKKRKTGNKTPSPEPDELYNSNRKDSQCSDVILLSISGRTSRLSSIGSQGSAKSRLSNASHFSIQSGHSAYSQCSSPHKTILETSFCGHRLSDCQTTPDEDEIKEDSEEFEKVLLSRKSNLTEGVVDLKKTVLGDKNLDEVSLEQTQAVNYNVLTENYNEKTNDKCSLPKKIISRSGVEYIYIPLKGPLPKDDLEEKGNRKVFQGKTAVDNNKILNGNTGPNYNLKTLDRKEFKQRSSPVNLAETSMGQPKYIRIKLKPDHCYDDESRETSHSASKPTCLNLSVMKENSSSSQLQFEHQTISVTEQNQTRSLSNTPSVSPKLVRRSGKGCSTPSPSVPRRNSLASLFRTGSESPSSLKRKRKNNLTNIVKNTNATTKSVDKNKSPHFPASSSTESVDSKGRTTSILSIFKPNTKEKGKHKDNNLSQDILPISKYSESIKSKKTAERRQETPLNSQSIRIPLHSPTYYANKSLLQELCQDAQDAQDTGIETSIQGNLDKLKPLEIKETLKEKESNKVVDEPNSSQTSEINCNNEKVETDTQNISKNASNPSFPDSMIEDSSQTKETMKALTTSSNNSIKLSQDIFSENSNNETIKMTCDVDSSHSLNKTGFDNNNSMIDDGHNSSESERDLEMDYSESNKPPDHKMNNIYSLEIERKAIVLQQDSFEDELPYIPTTLPLERSAAIPILPIKQRCVLDIKTCPIERPRSTTPIHSSGLDNYIDGFGKSELKDNKITKITEKLKISLPRAESTIKAKTHAVTTTCNAIEYAKAKEDSPPPLPPKGVQKTWINFEEVPERRKPPKRIQTIPSRGHIDISGLVLKDHVVYTYVNPEECKCECHDHKEQENEAISKSTQEEKLPLLDLEHQELNSTR